MKHGKQHEPVYGTEASRKGCLLPLAAAEVQRAVFGVTASGDTTLPALQPVRVPMRCHREPRNMFGVFYRAARACRGVWQPQRVPVGFARPIWES